MKSQQRSIHTYRTVLRPCRVAGIEFNKAVVCENTTVNRKTPTYESRIRSLRLLSHCSLSSFHLQIKQLGDVLASCEPGEMVQLVGGSCYCISAETAVISCTTHGRPNLLVVVYCASLVTHCHGSVSHELHCCLLGDINGEPLIVPVGCTSVSYSVVQNSSRDCGTPFFYCL